MDDEIQTFADGRPPVPPYSPQARTRARDRLLAEARGGSRFRLPRLGWQAAAAFGATIVLVGGVAVTLSGQSGKGSAPGTSAMLSADELNPLPGQFIEVESETMYGSHNFNGTAKTRYLYREHRKIWKSVDGSKDGLLWTEGRESRPWPGEALPSAAGNWNQSTWYTLNACKDAIGPFRDDYVYLSTLPTDPSAMRDYLYQGFNSQAAKEKPGITGENIAFGRAGDLLRENYFPKAQRDALFEAVKTIPGVEVADDVEDLAARKGVALGRVSAGGVLEQLIFDPATHVLMGERQTAADEKADAPVGSVLALTAEVKITVVDALPQAQNPVSDGSGCDRLPATVKRSEPQPPGDQPQPTSKTMDEPQPANATAEPPSTVKTPDQPQPTDEPPSTANATDQSQPPAEPQSTG
jgi:hypothetical protein